MAGALHEALVLGSDACPSHGFMDPWGKFGDLENYQVWYVSSKVVLTRDHSSWKYSPVGIEISSTVPMVGQKKLRLKIFLAVRFAPCCPPVGPLCMLRECREASCRAHIA
ncbi:hypothetical protein Tco_1491245 [Tanacetum coccineum]